MKIVLASLLALGSFAAQAAVVTHVVTKEVPASEILRIVVELPDAEVTIRNTSEKTLRVIGTYSTSHRGKDSKEAQAVVDAASLSIETNGPRAIIRRELSGKAGSFLARRSLDLKVEILAPSYVNIEVKQSSGHVKIDGTFRDIDVSMNRGDVSVRTAKRNVRELTASSRMGKVNTNIGDRTVSREGVLMGSTYFINDGGASSMKVAVRFGTVNIELLP